MRVMARLIMAPAPGLLGSPGAFSPPTPSSTKCSRLRGSGLDSTSSSTLLWSPYNSKLISSSDPNVHLSLTPKFLRPLGNHGVTRKCPKSLAPSLNRSERQPPPLGRCPRGSLLQGVDFNAQALHPGGLGWLSSPPWSYGVSLPSPSVTKEAFVP